MCSQAWTQAADIGHGNSFRAMCDRRVVSNGTCAEGRENHPTRQQRWAPARKDCQLGMKTSWQVTGSRDALSQLLRTLSPTEWSPPARTPYTTATDHKSFSRDTLSWWYSFGVTQIFFFVVSTKRLIVTQSHCPPTSMKDLHAGGKTSCTKKKKKTTTKKMTNDWLFGEWKFLMTKDDCHETYQMG